MGHRIREEQTPVKSHHPAETMPENRLPCNFSGEKRTRALNFFNPFLTQGIELRYSISQFPAENQAENY